MPGDMLPRERHWLSQYFARYQKSIFAPEIFRDLVRHKELLVSAKARGNKVVFAGGSAALASHCAVDFTKAAGVRAVTFARCIC